MDFFKELLESFSRKHNRKLRLLEQDAGFSDRLSKASKIVADALAQGSPSVNGFDAAGNTKPITIQLTQDGTRVKVQNRYLGWDGQTLSHSKPRDLKAAVTNLVGPEEAQKEKFKKEKDPEAMERQRQETEQRREEQERAARRQSVLDSDMARENPEIINEIVRNMDEFDQTLAGALCNEDGTINVQYQKQVSKEYRFRSVSDWNCKLHLQFLRGGRKGNVEQQIVNNVPVLRFDGKTGKYFVDSEPAVASQALEISRALNVLARAAGGDESAKKEACSRFKVTEGGGLQGVTVYTEVDSEGRGLTGRVFNNEGSARSLKGLMSMAGCSLEPQSATKAVAQGSAGAESHVRGTLGEVAKIVGTDLANLVAAKAAVGPGVETPEIKALQEIVVEKSREVLDLLSNLNESANLWIEKAQGAVVSEEEQAELEVISQIVGDKDKTVRFMTAVLTMAATTSRLRKPLVTVQVAEQVGAGDKQDVLECWGSREEALAGLRTTEEYEVGGEKKSRISEDDIAAVPASEVFKNNPELLDKYIKAGKIKSKDQILYASEVSLKTMLRLSSAKKGETTAKKANEVISKGKDPRAQNFNKKIAKKDQASIRQIQKEVHSISKGVEKLTTKVQIQTEDGVVTQNSLNTYAEEVVSHIRKNSTFDEIKDDRDLAELEEYIKAMKTDDPKMTDKKIQEKVRDKLFKMTVLSKIQNMANKGGADERRAGLHALALFNVAGGSNSDSTIFQVDTLDDMVSYVSTQNGEMQSALDSIKSGDGRWKFQPSKGSLTFSYADDPNRTISVTYKDGKWIAYRSATSIKNASTKTKAVGQEKSRGDESLLWNALGKLQEALGIIKEKVKVLDTH